MGRRFCLNLPMFTLLAPANSMKHKTPSMRYSSKPNSPRLSIKTLRGVVGNSTLARARMRAMIREKNIRAISLWM